METQPSPAARRLLALAPTDLPVLQATRQGIEHWSARRDEADANRLADLVLRDPLMVVRTLAYVAGRLGARLATPVQTVTAALVLTGMEPFFAAFADVPVLEHRLADQPDALQGALEAIERARAASRIAAAFAVHRQDDDAELLHQAALLHGFAGLLLWCEAPADALAIAARQRHDPQLRSADAQRAQLGTALDAIERELLERWGMALPLRQAGRGVDAAREQAVRLAVRIARHVQGPGGWHNAALPDDWAEAGALLHLPPAGAASLVRAAL
jgi:hypothetical protein